MCNVPSAVSGRGCGSVLSSRGQAQGFPTRRCASEGNAEALLFFPQAGLTVTGPCSDFLSWAGTLGGIFGWDFLSVLEASLPAVGG